MEMTASLLMAASFAALCCAGVAHHREVAEAIERFRDQWPRGGPPVQGHPSVARDGWFLTRKRRRS
ncbi:MAG: hypothetical protein SFV54_14070 [Bryobacteraceae bacterium]|nr:hypothetical protein [Bryobacteraceae bacterium]